VTGGGTGIGLMCAKAFAANGAKVYITGRREEMLNNAVKVHGPALEELGGKLVPIVMDVTKKESILAAVEVVKANDGFLSCLVNNAGGEGGRPTHGPKDGIEAYSKAMFAEADQVEKAWLNPYQLMCVAPYLCTAAFLPLIDVARKNSPQKIPGNIINISSLSGLTKWSQNGQFAYNCAKSAVIQLTRLLATDLCPEHLNIRVNSLAPGYFASELTTGKSGSDNFSPWPLDEYKAEMKRVHSLSDRPGTEQEMAQGILYLACNGYVNGQTVLIDGGLLLRHP
ncbi:hypothetical protein TREMEDRAFT_30985, partial [Tremella mesenterica DSM 1558]|uniref:uncharacterized protein n=1 Tax=Tremella mesenterica (strain ATCC 24925 / CBS 8224 / DSM 1558 / NBRC 9311 / NRRL Y-6157 / RJB 2259-6 / UBC 559-6) TaxID=578456 RepID=UPI0003F491E3